MIGNGDVVEFVCATGSFFAVYIFFQKLFFTVSFFLDWTRVHSRVFFETVFFWPCTVYVFLETLFFLPGLIFFPIGNGVGVFSFCRGEGRRYVFPEMIFFCRVCLFPGLETERVTSFFFTVVFSLGRGEAGASDDNVRYNLDWFRFLYVPELKMCVFFL